MSKAACDQGHECIIQEYIARFGEYKKIVRMSTGVAYRVPTRIIIEQGIREQDLDQFPLWEGDEGA